MADTPKHLVRTRELSKDSEVRILHPLNPRSEVFVHFLSNQVGMRRAQLSLARVPPGKESFIPHSHGLQEEFVFILEGQGMAQIGEHEVPVGPGDYMGFPTDGVTHHLINTGTTDLVYLMGGDRTELEVSRFPSIGKIGVFQDGVMRFFDEAGALELPPSAWIADKDQDDSQK